MTISIIAEINSQRAQAGARDFNNALASMRGGVAATNTSMGLMGSAAGALRAALGLLAIGGIAAAGKAAVKAADDFASLTARLGIVAKEGTGAGQLLDGIAEAANRARAPVGTLADIYRRNANALNDLGYSEAQGIRLAETLSKVTKISGVSASEATSSMIQLSQAITSGKFQGDEFKSVAENLPEVLRILEKQTGKTAKQLREMAEAGQLSGKVLTQALLNAGNDIDAKFSRMPKTAGEAFSQLTGQISLTFGEIANQTGVSQKFAEVFDQMRAAVVSPTFAAGAKFVSEALVMMGDALKAVGGFLAEARVQYLAWTQVISESSVYKLAVQGITMLRDGVASLWDTFSRSYMANADASIRAQMPEFVVAAERAQKLANELRTVEQLRGSISAAEPVRAAANPTKPGKIVFEESDLSKEMKKQIEAERLRGEIARASMEGDKARVRTLESQLEIHGRITAEMRKKEPALARELELMIATTNEAERRKTVQLELNQIGTEFANTVFQTFRQGVEDGKKFVDVLGSVALKLVDMIVQFTVMKPLAESIGKSIGGFMSGNGVSDTSDPLGIGRLLGGLGSGGFGLGFANGGVFDSPVAMAGAGGFRGRFAEAGPEAIMPLRRGAGGQLGVMVHGGGQQSAPNITINVAGDATEATVAKLRAVAREELARATPGIVKTSVGAVGDAHRRDSSYLRR